MIEGLVGAVIGVLVTSLYRDRHDIAVWWKYRRHGKSTAILTVPEDMLDSATKEWQQFRERNPDIVVIINGVEVK